MTNPQWQSDLKWLLAHYSPGRGGYKRLAYGYGDGDRGLSAYSDHVSPELVGYWVRRERTPNNENQRALLLLREDMAGKIKGGDDGE